ncbi:Oligosaccharyltransferase complex subunit [Dillenia turbinata]|uniref:Dolichyl-diphosphooligosaccharide-protein glycosyltransferase subunit OST5 n=1 Tax=Dillenia turbinata TaxID=194707 RepID=A0AAN8ZP02_9MAGN
MNHTYRRQKRAFLPLKSSDRSGGRPSRLGRLSQKMGFLFSSNISDRFYIVMFQAAKPISSPVPEAYYPTLAVLMISIGLVVAASFFIYEATSSRRTRSLAKELTTGAVASVFLVPPLSALTTKWSKSYVTM